MTFEKATKADIPELLELIVSCYRGHIAKKGWTSETDIIGGDRTTVELLKEEINAPGGSYLIHRDDQGKIIGCVYMKVNAEEKKAFVGSLCVYPTFQSQGLGRRLIAATEVIAKDAGCLKLCVKVITVRQELVDWYERMNYKGVGELIPLPAGSGIPKIPLELGTWEKSLN